MITICDFQKKKASGEKITMVIRPEKMAVAHGDTSDPAQTRLPLELPAGAGAASETGANGHMQASMVGKVTDSVFVGTDTRIYVTLRGGPELAVLVRNLDQDFKRGEKVTLTYDPADSRLLPAVQLGTVEEANGDGSRPKAPGQEK